MAVQKSKQTRVAGITAYKYSHPYIFHEVTECIAYNYIKIVLSFSMQGVWNSGLHVQPHLSISSVPNPLALRDGSEQQHQYSVISQANGISDPVSASAVPDQACACSQSVPISCSDQVDPTADVSSTCDVSEQQNDTGVHRDGAEQSTDSQTAV